MQATKNRGFSHPVDIMNRGCAHVNANDRFYPNAKTTGQNEMWQNCIDNKCYNLRCKSQSHPFTPNHTNLATYLQCFSLVNSGHCTKVSSAKGAKILPDRESFCTLHTDSTNTILVLVRSSFLSSHAAMLMGTHVPGPLHRTRSGLILHTNSHELIDALRVVIADDAHTRFKGLASYETLFGVKPLSDASRKKADKGEETTIERTRRLLYVTCTRVEESLALVLYSEAPDTIRRFLISKGWMTEEEVTMAAPGGTSLVGRASPIKNSE